MPGRQVLQSTFDSIVREGIEEFGLSPEEAISDAKEQLKKAGITDFSNLTTSIPSDKQPEEHDGVLLPRKIDHALKDGENHALLEAVNLLVSKATGKREVIGVAGSNGAVLLAAEVLSRALKDISISDDSAILAKSACQLVCVLCADDEVNRSRFIVENSIDGVNLLKSMLEVMHSSGSIFALQKEHPFDGPFYLTVMNAIIAVQRQSESVKRKIAAAESIDHLLQITYESGKLVCDAGENIDVQVFAKVFDRTCFAIRQLLTPDDSTVNVSENFNRARVMSGSTSVTDSGLRPLSTPKNLVQILHEIAAKAAESEHLSPEIKPRILTACLSTMRLCAVSDEICSDVLALHFDDIAFDAIRRHSNVPSLVQACLALLRNLSGRDQCKTSIFQRLTVVRDVIEIFLPTSAKAVELYGGLVASLCLRRPDIAREAALSGVLDVLVQGMNNHIEQVNVQRVGCLAIRNSCARDEEARKRLRMDGAAEKSIRKAWKLYPHAVDDIAYAALRDLDVLADSELRRDARYKMPAGFYSRKTTK